MAKKRKFAPKEEESTSEDEESPTETKTEDPSDDEDDDPQEEEEEEEQSESEKEESEEEDEAEDEEEDESSKRESVRKLLEPFGKDQIIEILKEAALKNPSIIDRISQTVESDPVHRKIFVHGLGWDATTETLLTVFKKFGQIEDCNAVTDKLTGKSKGFGFVLFKTRRGARKALKEPQKKIGNRMASCQLASLGTAPNQQVSNQQEKVVSEATGRKVYVSNVGPNVDPIKLRAFFAKFGEIEEGPFGCDRVTGKLRGFAIFLYKSTEGCNNALKERWKLFEGSLLQCTKALEGGQGNKNQFLEPMVAPASAPAASMQPNNLAMLTYSTGMNPGMVGQNLNPAAALMSQSSGIGVLNPSAFGTSLNHTGLSPSIASGVLPRVNRSGANPPVGLGASGLSPLMNWSGTTAPVGLGTSGVSPYVNQSGATPPVGLGVAFGARPAINTISPSVIGSYGSQAALQGLGAYQSTQQGQSAATTRLQSGIGTFPSYLGR